MIRIPLSLLIACALALPGTADEWPMACHDASRTGIADGDGPKLGEIAWSTYLGGSVDGSPVVVGDRIYVGTSWGNVYALDRASGQIIWRYDTGGAVTGAVAVGDGRVFVGSVDCFLHAVSADTGAGLWRHRTDRPVLQCVAFTDGMALLGSIDGTFRAVDPTTGRTRWSIQGPGGVSAPPAVKDGIAYYGDEAGTVGAVRIATGEAVWQIRVGGQVIAAPTIAGDRLLVPLMSHSALSPPGTEFVAAYSLTDGSKLWGIPKPGAQSVMGSPTITDTLVWALCVEGYVSQAFLRGLDLATGEQKIEQKDLGRLVVDAALARAGNTLYVAAENAVLYFIDATTGAVIKPVRMPGMMYSSPAIADGLLYVGCQDGKLYCVK